MNLQASQTLDSACVIHRIHGAYRRCIPTHRDCTGLEDRQRRVAGSWWHSIKPRLASFRLCILESAVLNWDRSPMSSLTSSPTSSLSWVARLKFANIPAESTAISINLSGPNYFSVERRTKAAEINNKPLAIDCKLLSRSIDKHRCSTRIWHSSRRQQEIEF